MGLLWVFTQASINGHQFLLIQAIVIFSLIYRSGMLITMMMLPLKIGPMYHLVDGAIQILSNMMVMKLIAAKMLTWIIILDEKIFTLFNYKFIY